MKTETSIERREFGFLWQRGHRWLATLEGSLANLEAFFGACRAVR